MHKVRPVKGGEHLCILLSGRAMLSAFNTFACCAAATAASAAVVVGRELAMGALKKGSMTERSRRAKGRSRTVILGFWGGGGE